MTRVRCIINRGWPVAAENAPSKFQFGEEVETADLSEGDLNAVNEATDKGYFEEVKVKVEAEPVKDKTVTEEENGHPTS